MGRIRAAMTGRNAAASVSNGLSEAAMRWSTTVDWILAKYVVLLRTGAVGA